MKRAKLGDVYAFKTERGYRIIHWAYNHDRWSEIIRIMPGFYENIPENIHEIIDGECSYMMTFKAPRLYRKGMMELICNIPISEKYPIPEFAMFYTNRVPIGYYKITDINNIRNSVYVKGDPTGSTLPEEYKNVKLVFGFPDPITFIYLITSDFDMQHWDLFWPKEKWDEFEKKYGDQIFSKKKKS